MHKLPRPLLEQLLKPQAQRSRVADATALQRCGMPALLREALQAAFNKSQVVSGSYCTHAFMASLMLLACGGM
jgi:aerobic-type carbon monoxide dehydrogenase small subunit (CoxS/CutS family)